MAKWLKILSHSHLPMETHTHKILNDSARYDSISLIPCHIARSRPAKKTAFNENYYELCAWNSYLQNVECIACTNRSQAPALMKTEARVCAFHALINSWNTSVFECLYSSARMQAFAWMAIWTLCTMKCIANDKNNSDPMVDWARMCGNSVQCDRNMFW